jgi:glycogen(starch) synthase
MSMRVLVISNLYPPHFIGGYELGCRDVVEGLAARGHDVTVLTSTYGTSSGRRDGNVERSLRLNFPVRPRRPLVDPVRTIRREVTNRRVVARACRIHRPDVVYVWSLSFLGPSIARVAQELGHPVCYFVSDYWLAALAGGRWPLSTQGLELRHAQFVSEHLKQVTLEAGHPVQDAEVIHWGVDRRRYRFSTDRGKPKRLLYVGRLIPDKGYQTALAALRAILDQTPEDAPTLTIVGGPDYGDDARRQVERLQLDDHVRFTGLVPRQELPAVYDSHDILVFPSVWPEPFSITLLEAMASGVAVVTTITGGSAELAEDGVNCLAFAPEDVAGCAANVLRLMNDRDLARRLRVSARNRIEERFLLDTMVERIERSLLAAVVSAGETAAAA